MKQLREPAITVAPGTQEFERVAMISVITTHNVIALWQ